MHYCSDLLSSESFYVSFLPSEKSSAKPFFSSFADDSYSSISSYSFSSESTPNFRNKALFSYNEFRDYECHSSSASSNPFSFSHTAESKMNFSSLVLDSHGLSSNNLLLCSLLQSSNVSLLNDKNSESCLYSPSLCSLESSFFQSAGNVSLFASSLLQSSSSFCSLNSSSSFASPSFASCSSSSSFFPSSSNFCSQMLLAAPSTLGYSPIFIQNLACPPAPSIELVNLRNEQMARFKRKINANMVKNNEFGGWYDLTPFSKQQSICKINSKNEIVERVVDKTNYLNNKDFINDLNSSEDINIKKVDPDLEINSDAHYLTFSSGSISHSCSNDNNFVLYYNKINQAKIMHKKKSEKNFPFFQSDLNVENSNEYRDSDKKSSDNKKNSDSVLINFSKSISNEVYMSRQTLLQFCENYVSCIQDVKKSNVKIQAQLLHQMLPSMQPRKIFEQFYAIPLNTQADINRYMEKRRMQNAFRRLIENIWAYKGNIQMEDFFDELCSITHRMFTKNELETEHLTYNEFDKALEILGIWPSELNIYDKYEIFDLIYLSNNNSKIKAFLNKSIDTINKRISKTSFLKSIKFLPFNMPDFPIPEIIRENSCVNENLSFSGCISSEASAASSFSSSSSYHSIFFYSSNPLDFLPKNLCHSVANESTSSSTKCGGGFGSSFFDELKYCYIALLLSEAVGIKLVFKEKSSLSLSKNLSGSLEQSTHYLDSFLYNKSKKNIENLNVKKQEEEELEAQNYKLFSQVNPFLSSNALLSSSPSICNLPNFLSQLSLSYSPPVRIGISSNIFYSLYQNSNSSSLHSSSLSNDKRVLGISPYSPAWGRKKISKLDKNGFLYNVGCWNFVPNWHLTQDFLMSRLVSLEEMQVVLYELHSITDVKNAFELIVAVATKLLLPFELYCVLHPSSPLSQPLNIQEIAKRCVNTTLFDFHSNLGNSENNLNCYKVTLDKSKIDQNKCKKTLNVEKVAIQGEINSKLGINWKSYFEMNTNTKDNKNKKKHYGNRSFFENNISNKNLNNNGYINNEYQIYKFEKKKEKEKKKNFNLCLKNGKNTKPSRKEENEYTNRNIKKRYNKIKVECELIRTLINAKRTRNILEKLEIKADLNHIYCIDIFTLQILCEIFYCIFTNSIDFCYIKDLLLDH